MKVPSNSSKYDRDICQAYPFDIVANIDLLYGMFLCLTIFEIFRTILSRQDAPNLQISGTGIATSNKITARARDFLL